jgi:ubiquinone/menaquinone biosynthesis C-methylase UbiE
LETWDFTDQDLVDAYDQVTLWSAAFGRLLLDHVPLTAVSRVLDVGCGTGFPLLELAGRLGPGVRMVGVDPWRQALRRARFKAAQYRICNVSVVDGDAAALPFAEASFDLVTSNLGLNNFAAPAAAAAECARVARPGASLVLTTNLQGHMAEVYQALAGVLDDAEAQARLQRHVAHRATVADATTLLGEAGFEVTAVHEQSMGLRYLDGTALLHDSFVRFAFLPAWVEVAGDAAGDVIGRLETALNGLAHAAGELRLTVPMACLVARRAGS